MEFYNDRWPSSKTMNLYDCVELKNPVGFVHFPEPKKEITTLVIEVEAKR